MQSDIAEGRSQVTAGEAEIELQGSPSDLRFPDVCACCGAPARKQLLVERAFLHQYHDSLNHWSLARARVPFCASCILRHQRDVEPRNLSRTLRSYLAVPQVLAALCSSAFLVWLVVRAITADSSMAGFFWLLCMLFGAIAACLWTWTWWRSRHLRISPETAVTRAFDFSTNLAPPLSRRRHRYRLRNSVFAAAFTVLNKERLWDPAQPAARLAEGARLLAVALLLVAAVAWAAYSLLMG